MNNTINNTINDTGLNSLIEIITALRGRITKLPSEDSDLYYGVDFYSITDAILAERQIYKKDFHIHWFILRCRHHIDFMSRDAMERIDL